VSVKLGLDYQKDDTTTSGVLPSEYQDYLKSMVGI
jgi:hypothetical protein